MDSPASLNTITVNRIEIGIASNEITVVRTFSRKANRITATTMMASSSASSTLLMLASMKLDWRNSTWSAFTPAGRVRLRSCNAASTAFVSGTVSAPGCFCTDMMTAGLPPDPASPRLKRGAKSTAATWLRMTAWPSFMVTTRLRRSSMRVVRPMLRTTYSARFWSTKPPPVLAPNDRIAFSTSSSVTSSRPICATLGVTWYCRTSPPIGMTCATPGMDSSRGRIVKSANSRTCMGVVFASAVMAISMISPIMDVIGPICGTTRAGSCSRTAAMRSATCWRLRYTSVPQANSTNTMDRPTPDTERTRVTPGMPFMAVSNG